MVDSLSDDETRSLLGNNEELLDAFRDNADENYYGVNPSDIPAAEIKEWLKSRG